MAESMQGLKRSHRCTEVGASQIGTNVTVMGWVQKSRNKGGIIFVDLRDRSWILQIIFEVGAERYHIIFDTVRGIIQPFFCGQDQNYNFFLKLRIDSDTKISVSVNSLKGYSLSDFANKLIWVRTYYA